METFRRQGSGALDAVLIRADSISSWTGEKFVSARETFSEQSIVVQDVVMKTTAKLATRMEYVALRLAEPAVAGVEQAAETGKVAHEAVSNVADTAMTKAGEAAEQAGSKAKDVVSTTGEVVAQPSFKVSAASATTGAVALGAAGAAGGLTAGGALGAAAGLPLALFTFGLSIPLGAAIGAGAGVAVGTATGASAGLVSGGAAGYGIYQNKDEISHAASTAAAKAGEGAELMRGKMNASVGYAVGALAAARARVTGMKALE